MKVKLTSLAIILAMLTACGCTSTHIKAGRYEFNRTSFMQSVDVEVVADSDGNIRVIYSNDGGGKVAGAAAGMAVQTIVR